MGMFKRATRKGTYLKLALSGPSGSGKTMSALRIARGLSDKIAILDTENRSASLYADKRVVDARTGEAYEMAFDSADILPPYQAEAFTEAIASAHAAGYGVLLIDSASHIWEAVLQWKELQDRSGANSFTNWNAAGRKYANVIDLIRSVPMHIIVCMRSKMEYVLELNEKGKQVPRKVGMAPIMRENTEYEFSMMLTVDMQHLSCDTKHRFSEIFGTEPFLADEATGEKLRLWLEKAEPLPADETWTEELKERGRALRDSARKAGVEEATIAEVLARKASPSETLASLQALIDATQQGGQT